MPDLRDREKFERELRKAFATIGADKLAEVLRLLGEPPDVDNVPASFWRRLADEISTEIEPLMERVYLAGARALADEAAVGGVAWDVVKAEAAQWASAYTFGLVKGIEDTSRDLLRRGVRQYFETPMTQGDLRRLIEPTFGVARAQRIAVTEVTRASALGEFAIATELRGQGVELVPVWQTNNDDLVCPVCGPLNGKKLIGEDIEALLPPAHVNCRCWINYEPVGIGDAQAPAATEANNAVGGALVTSESNNAKVMGYSFFRGELPSVSAARELGESADGWKKYEKVFTDEYLPRFNVTDDIHSAIGLWGGPEPSFNAWVKGDEQDIIALAKAWGRDFNQEAMALLIPDKNGEGGALTFAFNQKLTDTQLDAVIDSMREVNAELSAQTGVTIGLSVRENKILEYWYATEEESNSAELMLRFAFERAGISALQPNKKAELRRILLFINTDY
jgi:hypothetical protein